LEQFGCFFRERDAWQTPEIKKTHPDAEPWLRHVVGDEQFYTIDSIHYTGGSDLAGPSIKIVAQLPRVNTLSLFLAQISDADLSPLANSDIVLKRLDLSCTDVTDRGLTFVGRLRTLRELDLEGTSVTDAGLAHLRGLRRLEVLNARGDFTDEGLLEIRHLRELRYLAVDGNRITAAGLEHLRELPDLETLDLCEVPVDDDGIAVLSTLPNVKHMSFSTAHCSPEALKRLKNERPAVQLDLR
jgi:hypothetical protein